MSWPLWTVIRTARRRDERAQIGRGCGFDVDWPDRPGTFVVWGSARDQVDGFGNAVSPAVGEWIGTRLRAALHAEDVNGGGGE